MPELLGSTPPERTKTRQFVDKIGRATAPVSFGLETVGTGAAIVAGSVAAVAIGGTLMYMHLKQWGERNKSPQEQSPFNVERILDRLGIGTKKANTRSALSAA